jgi:hypothetical protein
MRAAEHRPASAVQKPHRDNVGQPIWFGIRRFYRIFRWVSLAGLLAVIVLILHASPPPRIETNPIATQRAEDKVQEFRSCARQGIEGTLSMDQPELNGWLNQNLALKRPDRERLSVPSTPESAVSLINSAMTAKTSDEQALEQAKSTVRDLKIELLEDHLCVYATFDLHGVDLLLELEGRISARDGYLRLEPTRGKLGSLPLMAGTLQSVTAQLFDKPENKEKFRLPPHIQDVRIEGGQLIIASSGLSREY